jgi:hypothetical protein
VDDAGGGAGGGVGSRGGGVVSVQCDGEGGEEIRTKSRTRGRIVMTWEQMKILVEYFGAAADDFITLCWLGGVTYEWCLMAVGDRQGTRETRP